MPFPLRRVYTSYSASSVVLLTDVLKSRSKQCFRFGAKLLMASLALSLRRVVIKAVLCLLNAAWTDIERWTVVFAIFCSFYLLAERPFATELKLPPTPYSVL